MIIYTLNVGQGQFVIVTDSAQAIIIDTYVPLNPTNDIINIKGALARILQNKELIGLIITGYDADHFNEVGLRIILNKYRPNWIMYPKYLKETSTANECFRVIKNFELQKKFERVSVALSNNDSRFYEPLSSNFKFEFFSPHRADMNSSNNCSLVCRIKENSSNRTYLITGDTENDRWSSITYYFSRHLSSDVLAAPHHGSKNGMSRETLDFINPHTILISAGVDNQYGHPDYEALCLFSKYNCYSTNKNRGQSLKTIVSRQTMETELFTA